MAKAQTITISLPSAMATLLHQQVAAGKYASISEVVGEAVRDWLHQQSVKQRDRQTLRSLLQEAIDSGPGEDAETVFARLSARYST